MYFRYFACLLVCLHGSAFAAVVAPEQKVRDEETLKAANQAADAPALMAFFKKHTIGEVDRERIKKLINDMGDDSFDVRQKANEQLILIGVGARGQLREATQNTDVEISIRAARALEQIEKEGGPPVVCAAARLLAARNPDGTAEVLLNFLPSAEDQIVVDEVSRALVVAGFAPQARGGKPLPALIDALTDKSPVRRGVAAEALCRGGGELARPLVRKMLKDPDTTVRLRAALALFDVHEKESIPILIALLAELPRDQAWRAEDVLYIVAGDKPPNGTLGNDDVARREYRKLWEQWWKDNGEGLDLAKLDQKQRQLGYTLICQLDINKGGASAGRVQELDAEGKVRWQIEGLRYPVDAQMIGEDRVLVSEYTGRQVTERNLKGEILWTKAVGAFLLGARRLANGNTFIVARGGLMEVDKDGTQVMTITRQNDVAAGARMRNGDYAIVTTNGVFVRLDAKGNELKSFPVGQVQTVASNLEVLPNGRVIVPLYSASKVVEYDAEGKVVWEASVQLPSSVVRLPNGNTLVASRNTRTIVELDRTGKEVAKVACDGMPLKATRR